MSGVGGNHSHQSIDAAAASGKLFATPLARRLARERRLNLAHVRGSGPRGRIIAADLQPAPEAEPPHAGSAQVSALAVGFGLTATEAMLAEFSKAGLSIDFEDVAIRAASAALLAVSGAGTALGTVCLEQTSLNLRCADAAAMSLSAVHAARVQGASAEKPQPAAALSINVLGLGGIVPTLMPPRPGVDMRLLITTATVDGQGSATLFFDEARIAVESATAILRSLKQHLEQPVLLLL